MKIRFFLPYRLFSLLVLSLVTLVATPSLYAESLEDITFLGATGKYKFKNDVFLDMLHLSLSKTQPEYGGYTLSQIDWNVKQARAVEEMHLNCHVDLTWLVSSNKREDHLLPVKIPLLKGLFGLRVPMIHKDSKPAFDGVDALAKLRYFVAGQGHDWPDTKILQHNKLNVLPVSNFPALFKMLSQKKIDYFPRSVAEIQDELNLAGDESLMAHSSIMLYYPSPIYFFLCPEKQELAKRLEVGLELAIKDGSFDKVFKTSREYRAFEDLGTIENKQIYYLINPELDIESLPSNKEYWILGKH